MEFRRLQLKPGPHRDPRRVALVPGSYNPPTNAHRALLEAALSQVDEAVALLPRTFPHKSYEGGVSLEDRIRMLEQMSPEPYSIAISEGGLFIEMAEEFQVEAGPAEVFLACGRDAAERILSWDYSGAHALDRMFERFQLLVASRQGEFTPPELFRDRIHPLELAPEHDALSSTAVRERIEAGVEWRHLVPDLVAPLMEKLYFPWINQG